MRCLFACFIASSKHKKRLYLVNTAPSKDHHRDGAAEALQLDVTTEHQVIEEPIQPISESKEKKKLEEQLSCNGKRYVTFDLNAKSYEALVGNNEEKESEKEEPSNEIKSIPNVISSNERSCSPNHICRNYSKEEFLLDGDLDDGSDSKILVQEESSESLFSLSIDSRKQAYGGEVGEKEVSSPMPKCGVSHEELKPLGPEQYSTERIQYVDSVLNPVENLTRWKAVKARATLPFSHQDKENINMEGDIGTCIISQEPSFELLSKMGKANLDQKKLLDKDIAVDTSLSSWLVESETTPLSKGSANSVGNSAYGRGSSPRNHEDRHILGALTMEQIPGSVTPRLLRSLSPEDTPILGTVGSYWRHTGQMVDSDSSSSSKGMLTTARKFSEDERANCNSTPFEARLDRALDKIIAQV